MKFFFEENVYISDLDAILCLVKPSLWSHELPGLPLIRDSLHFVCDKDNLVQGGKEGGSCLHTHDFLICFV